MLGFFMLRDLKEGSTDSSPFIRYLFNFVFLNIGIKLIFGLRYSPLKDHLMMGY